MEGPLERLSDSRTVPYLRFFLVRNEEALGGFVTCAQRICATKGVHPTGKRPTQGRKALNMSTPFP